MTGARERGAVSVLMVAVVVLAGFLALGVARVGRAAALKARAQTAADAAALGRGPDAARLAAADIAVRNDAHLVRCDCAGVPVIVVVTLGEATARAGAEVVASCRWRPDRC